MRRPTLGSITLLATVFVIGCDRSPSSMEKVSGPTFLAVVGSGTWTPDAPMPTGRTYPSVGVINGILYSVGGEGNFTELTVTEAYDPATNSWASKAAAPTGVDQSAAGVVNGVLYVVGGSTVFACSGGYVGTNRAYDPSTDTWTTRTPMPTPRCGAAAAALGGLLYVVGGAVGGAATLEAYDPASDTWTTKAPIPTPRELLAAAVVSGVLYVLGGHDNSGVLSTVEAYDPATNAWTTKTPMPTARCCVAAEVVDGILYAVGGGSATGLLNTVEAYDPLTDAWTTVAGMPTARCCVGVGVINGTLFALGGNTSSSKHLIINEAFTPLVTHVLPSATFTVPSSVLVGSPIQLSLTNARVPGHPEATTFTFAFDCGDGAGYGAFGGSTTASCPTSAVGSRVVRGTVEDQDGDTQGYTGSVSIVYNFSGFVAPVDNPPIVNVAKAGSAIPVKFSLHGNQGLNILATGSPSSRTILCDNGAPQDDIESTVAAGGSSLSYDPVADLYTYVWKTDKTWAGACRELTVTLNDNSMYKAEFKFTK